METQSHDSVPPAPACILTMALFLSYCPENKSVTSVRSRIFLKEINFVCSSASSWASFSASRSSSTVSISSNAAFNSAWRCMSYVIPFISVWTFFASLVSFQKLGSCDFLSSSPLLKILLGRSKIHLYLGDSFADFRYPVFYLFYFHYVLHKLKKIT